MKSSERVNLRLKHRITPVDSDSVFITVFLEDEVMGEAVIPRDCIEWFVSEFNERFRAMIEKKINK